MKFSIYQMARLGMAAFFLNLCPSLQAAQEDIQTALKNLNFDCKAEEGILPKLLVKEKIVPDSVTESEELWRYNAIFLKDGLELIAFGSNGNEILTVSDHIINNADQIANFLKRETCVDEEADQVKFLLVEQAFTLYAYTIALQFDPANIPEIKFLLENQNANLFKTLAHILRVKGKDRDYLARTLENRLNALQSVAYGFVHASVFENFEKAYCALDASLWKGQEVGSTIGWTLFFKR